MKFPVDYEMKNALLVWTHPAGSATLRMADVPNKQRFPANYICIVTDLIKLFYGDPTFCVSTVRTESEENMSKEEYVSSLRRKLTISLFPKHWNFSVSLFYLLFKTTVWGVRFQHRVCKMVFSCSPCLPFLSWVAWQLHIGPTTCGTFMKHSTKHF